MFRINVFNKSRSLDLSLFRGPSLNELRFKLGKPPTTAVGISYCFYSLRRMVHGTEYD